MSIYLQLQVKVRSIARHLKSLKTDTIVRLRGLKFFNADPLLAVVFQDTILTVLSSIVFRWNKKIGIQRLSFKKVNPECDEGIRLRAYMGTTPVKKENDEQKKDGNNLQDNGGSENSKTNDKKEIKLPENGGGENPETNDGKEKEGRAQ